MKQWLFLIIKLLLKSLLLVFITLIVYFTLGVNWPQSELPDPPIYTDKILLKNVSVVDAVKDSVMYHQSILIEKGLIKKILPSDSTIKITEETITFNLEGQFVMPGLWDMHAHTTKFSPRLHFPLFIANGVTGIREMGLYSLNKDDSFFTQMEDKNIWNEQIENGVLIGPKLKAIASHVIESEQSLNSFTGNSLEDKINDFIKTSKKRGADFIKVQLKGEKSRAIFLNLVSNTDSLPVVGHQPEDISIKHASMVGLKSLEHAKAILNQNKKPKDSLLTPNELLDSLALRYDKRKMMPLYKSLKAFDTYYCPTHLTRRWEANFQDSAYLNDPRLKYVPLIQRVMWWVDQRMMLSIIQENESYGLKSFYETGLTVTKDAHDSGVKIMAGTDALDSYIFYGFSLHDELEEMVKAGLSPAEAIITATYNPAIYLNKAKYYGTVEEGKVAELIILKSNPLANVSNTRSIQMVIQKNKIYDSEKIEELKNWVVESSNEFGSNSKMLWALIKSII